MRHCRDNPTSARCFSAFRRCCLVFLAGSFAALMSSSIGSSASTTSSSNGSNVIPVGKKPSFSAFSTCRADATLSRIILCSSTVLTRCSSISWAERRSSWWAETRGLYEEPWWGSATAGTSITDRGCERGGGCCGVSIGIQIYKTECVP